MKMKKEDLEVFEKTAKLNLSFDVGFAQRVCQIREPNLEPFKKIAIVESGELVMRKEKDK